MGKACAPTRPKLDALSALVKVFETAEFRELCKAVTQCGDLATRVDLSSQVYPRGSHLLCHDDVIGTRKVSFIYYLTDPSSDWTNEEGGVLELYPQMAGAPPGTPSAVPSKCLLPLADSLAVFLVEPGVSFHAVSEVRSSRARLSIQGWLHAPSLELTKSFANRDLATLQQILSKKNDAEGRRDCELTNSVVGTVGEELTPQDVEFLGRWIAPEYLGQAQVEEVAVRFVDASYAVLTHFLRADVFTRLAEGLRQVDATIGVTGKGAESGPIDYNAGAVGGWDLVGPPHLQRYLRFTDAQTETANTYDSSEKTLGVGMREIADTLFRSVAFKRWLKASTRLAPKDAGNVEVRRFRPGLDYTVAVHRGADEREAHLDATLVFVDDSTPESAELWASEEVGGFESYLAVDDDDETAELQEVYRGADPDEGPLVNLPAATNTLCLVARDAKTLRFAKYLGSGAPSSRVDVVASYGVDLPEGDDSDEDANES